MEYSCCLSILAKERSPALTRLYLSLAHPLWVGHYVFVFLVMLETTINENNSKVNLKICEEVTSLERGAWSNLQIQHRSHH